MDPVTAVQLVDAAISLLKVCHAVLQTIRELKHADERLAEVLHELTSFKEFLDGMQRVLENPRTSHRISREVLKNDLDEASFTVTNLARRLDRIKNARSTTRRRLAWLNVQTDVSQLRNRLRHHSFRLNGFLTLVYSETFLHVCSQQPLLLQRCTEAQEELDGRADLIMGIPVEDSSFSLVASIEPSWKGSKIEEVEDVNTEKLDVKHGPEVPSGPGLRRKSCTFNCYCDCHSDDGPASANLVVKLRSATVDVVSRSRRPCSTGDCLRSQVPLGGKKKLILPSSKFKRAVTSILIMRGMTRKYHLSTYRVVSQTWSSARYANRGDLQNLKACIESGEGTPYDTQPDGWSLLHTAAYLGHLDVVVYLLSIGADVDVGEIGNRKPVDLAILRALAVDATETHKQIMKAFPRVEEYLSDFGFTPIHRAALGLYDSHDRTRPTLQQLIDLADEADNLPAATNWNVWKRLYALRSEEHAKIMASPLSVEIVEMFRAAAAELDPTEKPILKIINQKDEKWGWPPFHWAAFTGRLDEMKILCANNANPFVESPMERNVIHIACESKRTDVLSYVLELWKLNKGKLDINKHDRWEETPLHVAASYSEACVRLLLKEGADLNARQENGQVPLHYAYVCKDKGEQLRIVSLLANQQGILINSQDEEGRTPVFELLDSPACVRALAEHGADFSISDKSGGTAVHYACMEDKSEALEDLFQLSPDPGAATRLNGNGNTPLIEACAHKSSCCALTLAKRQDVECSGAGKDGWTAVHHAAAWGDADVLEALLTHPSFKRGKETTDNKSTEIIAKESCNWSGRVRELLKTYDSVAGHPGQGSYERKVFYEAAAFHLAMK